MNFIKSALNNFSPYRQLRGRYHQYQAYTKWKLNGSPVPPPSIVKQWTIKSYAKKFNIKNFVETGTCFGTTLEIVKNDFRQLYSIELSETLYEQTKSRLAYFNNINLFQGDSAEVLPKIIQDINEPILFWLDAHYSCGVTARGNRDTPISSEVESILKHPLCKQHVILIDDARDFNGENDYPSLADLEKFILEDKTYKHFEVIDDIIRIHN